MIETETTPKWQGWFRASRCEKWRVVASGDDEQATHDAMLDAVAESGDFMLCNGNTNPNEVKV